MSDEIEHLLSSFRAIIDQQYAISLASVNVFLGKVRSLNNLAISEANFKIKAPSAIQLSESNNEGVILRTF